ncbi:hypothetical protein EW145_g7762 [Phellinidium pouzarii]|uniref:Uncharacterized protein n=1 Tax=Phellinidium pouzarii TaxID=167371 RepID=A0A4S4KG81_9AGAM|nr:hypothetical protein EW145_g7762 [Phellinidium pouzarii]
MAGRRHVAAVDRKSHEDKSGSEATLVSTSTSTTAHNPLHLLSPSSAARRDSRELSFDIKKLFGDRHDKEKDTDRAQQLVSLGPRARTPPPIPPSSASALASSLTVSANASGDMTSPPSSSKIHTSPSKVSDTENFVQRPFGRVLAQSGDGLLFERSMLSLRLMAAIRPNVDPQQDFTPLLTVVMSRLSSSNVC